MRIGIDIDGVLYPWTDVANRAVMDKFGVEDPGPHLHWDYLAEVIGEERFGWLWTRQGQETCFSDFSIYPGARRAFTAIMKDPANKVHFVTHRDPRYTARFTAGYLSFHFDAHPWAGLHVLQNGTPKHGLAYWDVFVDDKPETVYSMLTYTNAMVFAPARPWNTELHEYGSRRLIRYEDPAEVADWVASHG